MSIISSCLEHHLLQSIVADHDYCKIRRTVFIDQRGTDGLSFRGLLRESHCLQQFWPYVLESIDVAAVVTTEFAKRKQNISLMRDIMGPTFAPSKSS
jgi:hypothetical protein